MHDTVACTTTPPNARYGGLRYRATERRIRWRGTSATPPKFKVMVASKTTPPLRIKLWREIGGFVDPR
jgi:hypothetical protein